MIVPPQKNAPGFLGKTIQKGAQRPGDFLCLHFLLPAGILDLDGLALPLEIHQIFGLGKEEILDPMDTIREYQERRTTLNAEIDKVLAELEALLPGGVSE